MALTWLWFVFLLPVMLDKRAPLWMPPSANWSGPGAGADVVPPAGAGVAAGAAPCAPARASLVRREMEDAETVTLFA